MALVGEMLLGAFGANPQRAATLADELLAHSVKHSLVHYEAWGRFHRNGFVTERGNLQHRIDIMEAAVAAADTTHTKVHRSLHLGGLAAAYALLGQPEMSLGLLDDAIETVDKTNEKFFEAELYRLRGETLLASGRSAEAAAQLKHALTVARRQRARFWELRAAASLARLWHGQGKQAKARDLLAPIYNWFNEGFDLPALKDAKALLAELTQ